MLHLNRYVRVALFAALLLSAPLVPGQVSSATITGAVLDDAGAFIPHAKVTLTDEAAGTHIVAESNDQGQYTLPLIKPGTYSLDVDAVGFRHLTRKNIVLSAGDHPNVDVPMQVGAIDQTVEVTAAPPILQTADASIGQVVTTKQVESLPLNGRTPLTFAQYTVGVIATTNPSGVHAYDNSAASGFSVGGVANKNSEILLDGSPDNASDNAIAYSPPIEATAEVKLDIFETDAAYGHSGGGVANQVTKSGTNLFHGSLFEYNQVSALNANNFFNNRNGVKKTVYRYNQYGGSIGGPVWIPKVFDGRDKLFFVFAYEGIKNATPLNTFVTVPTAAERTGDFSALLAQGSQYQIYNPFSATTVNGVVTRQRFANNILNAPLNPIALKALQYFPAPNVAGNALGQNNYYASNNQLNTFSNEFGRVDWNLGAKNRIYSTVRHSRFDQFTGQYFGASDPALGDELTRENWGGSLGDIYTFSPSTIGELRLNYTRYVQNQVTNGDGFDGSAQLGLPASLVTASRRALFPIFSLVQFQSLGTSSTSPNLAPFNSYGIYGDVIKALGDHNLKFGVDARLFEKGQFVFGNSEGRFNFDNTWTRASSTSTSTVAGQDLAAFLLGLPTTATYDVNASSVSRQHYLAAFAQDDWRVRSDLTLNMGLRFDKDFSPTERNGRVVNGFNSTAASPISGAAIAAYNAAPVSQIPSGQFAVNGGLTFASAADHSFSQFTSNMFSPRFGFAYSPKSLGGDTVIRGGVGLFVLPVFPFTNPVNQEGFSQTTSSPVTTNNYLSANANLSNPFPNGFAQPSGSSLGLSTFLGNSITYFSPTVRNGYSERFTLGIQRQLPGSWLTEVVYVGSTNHRLPINYYPNFIPAKYLTTTGNAALSNSVTNPFRGLLPNSGTLNGSTVSNAQLLAVYPEFPVTPTAQTGASSFNGITVQNAPFGSSNYNALDVRVEKRTQKGLTLIANYQFSKNLEAVTYLNFSDPRPEYRISQYDRPHHAVIGVTYDLPYGRGRAYGGGAPRWLDLPFGGWTANSVFLYQSGAPLNFGNVLRASGTGTGSQGISYNPRAVDGFALNRSAFVTASAAQPQFNLRTFASQYSNVRADAISNWDASVLKNFRFTEAAYFQFRFEAFNVNNRPTFSAPNITPTSGSFGQITGTANTPRTIQLGGRIVF